MRPSNCVTTRCVRRGLARQRSAVGAVEGVGAEGATVRVKAGTAAEVEERRAVADQVQAVRWCVDVLGGSAQTIDAVGFKAVHGGPIDRPIYARNVFLSLSLCSDK